MSLLKVSHNRFHCYVLYSVSDATVENVCWAVNLTAKECSKQQYGASRYTAHVVDSTISQRLNDIRWLFTYLPEFIAELRICRPNRSESRRTTRQIAFFQLSLVLVSKAIVPPIIVAHGLIPPFVPPFLPFLFCGRWLCGRGSSLHGNNYFCLPLSAVAHCHIFGHSDTGMMMNFEIFSDD